MAEIRDTADIREKMLAIWKKLDENKVSATEVRLHIGIARAVLETLKVEMAAAHLNQTRISPVAVTPATVKVLRELKP